jgi:hypothetical protein
MTSREQRTAPKSFGGCGNDWLVVANGNAKTHAYRLDSTKAALHHAWAPVDGQAVQPRGHSSPR